MELSKNQKVGELGEENIVAGKNSLVLTNFTAICSSTGILLLC